MSDRTQDVSWFALADSLDTGVLLVDEDGTVIEANTAAESLLQADQQSIDTVTSLSALSFPPISPGQWQQARGNPSFEYRMCSSEAVDGAWIVELRPIAPEGPQHPQEDQINPQADAGVDSQQYGQLLSVLGDPAYIADTDGKIQQVNDRLVDITDYPQTTLVGSHVTLIFDEADVATADQLLTELVTEGSREYEIVDATLIDAHQSTVPVEVTLGLLPFETRFKGHLGVLRDVTDREQRIEQLEQYEAVLNELGDPVFVVDRDGRISFTNAAFEAELGYSTAVRDFVDFVPARHLDTIRSTVRQLVDADDPDGQLIESYVMDAAGRQIPVEMTVTPMYEQREFIGTAFVARDITDRRRRQELLTVINRVLRHNLRTKMNTIEGYADLIVQTDDQDEQEAYLAQINDSVDWLSELGDSLRELQALIEGRREGVEHISTDDIEAVVDQYRNDHPTAVVQYSSSLNAESQIDAVAVPAIEEVLDNAVVHAGPDPTVEVSVSAPTPQQITVTIADDGPGLPETEQAVVFGDTEVTQLEHGSGIGLWVTRWLVEMAGGQVEIETPDDGGSIVRLSFPRL